MIEPKCVFYICHKSFLINLFEPKNWLTNIYILVMTAAVLLHIYEGMLHLPLYHSAPTLFSIQLHPAFTLVLLFN